MADELSASLVAQAGNAGYVGLLDQFAANAEQNAHAFLVKQILSTIATSALVQVMKVTNAGGIAPVGLLDVQPMVAQVDGAGNATPHGVIHNLPYFRLQGGANAIILDPVVGDIGIAVFASRDISTVKASKKAGTPGSFRRYDWSDGLYLGGFLNGVPNQYIAFSSTGIAINTAQKLTITSANLILDANGNLAVTGGVVSGVGSGDQVGLQSHKHGTGTAVAGTSIPTAGT